MPALIPAAAGASAIGATAATTAAAAGAAGALGSGIAAGAALAGGTGLLGGLGLSAIGAPAIGGIAGTALAPAVATVAPAAAAQAAGTLVPSVAQSAGLDVLKSQALRGGLSQMPTAGLTQAAVNPTLAMQTQAAQQSAALARQNLLAQSGGQNVMGGAAQQAPNVIQQAHTVSGPGLNPNALQMPSLTNPTASPLSTAQAANPADIVGRGIRPEQNFIQNLGNISSFQDVQDYAAQHPYATSAGVGLGAMGLAKMMQPSKVQTPESNAMIRPYTYERTQNPEAYATSPTTDSSERMYFNDRYVAGEPYKATEKAEGGIASAYAMGGPVEQMSAMNAVGANSGYPMANINTPLYSNPMMQRPEATNVIAPSVDAGVGAYSGEPRFADGGETTRKYPKGSIMEAHSRKKVAPPPLPKYDYNPTTMQFTQTNGGGNKVSGGIATPATAPMQPQPATPINVPPYQSPEQQLGLNDFYSMMDQRLAGYGGFSGYAAGGGVGGEPNLGGYSDGGRLLKGPGDGVSDSIPASIGDRQPARLADGEFVVPARIVSELGNGSTEAGARKLYAMMERVQKSRKKSIGKGKVAVDSKASKHLPA